MHCFSDQWITLILFLNTNTISKLEKISMTFIECLHYIRIVNLVNAEDTSIFVDWEAIS